MASYLSSSLVDLDGIEDLGLSKIRVFEDEIQSIVEFIESALTTHCTRLSEFQAYVKSGHPSKQGS